MATNLQVFLREKISELNTPDTVFEYTTDYDIKTYAKRQMYITGSFSTVLAKIGTQADSDFEVISYGRVSNIDNYPIDVKLVNEDNDIAIFTLEGGEHLMIPNQNMSNSVGSTETLTRIEAQVQSGTGRNIKVEYFLASNTDYV